MSRSQREVTLLTPRSEKAGEPASNPGTPERARPSKLQRKPSDFELLPTRYSSFASTQAPETPPSHSALGEVEVAAEVIASKPRGCYILPTAPAATSVPRSSRGRYRIDPGDTIVTRSQRLMLQEREDRAAINVLWAMEADGMVRRLFVRRYPPLVTPYWRVTEAELAGRERINRGFLVEEEDAAFAKDIVKEFLHGRRCIRGIGALERSLTHYVLRRRAIALRFRLAREKLWDRTMRCRQEIQEEKAEEYSRLVHAYLSAGESAARFEIEKRHLMDSVGMMTVAMLFHQRAERFEIKFPFIPAEESIEASNRRKAQAMIAATSHQVSSEQIAEREERRTAQLKKRDDRDAFALLLLNEQCSRSVLLDHETRHIADIVHGAHLLVLSRRETESRALLIAQEEDSRRKVFAAVQRLMDYRWRREVEDQEFHVRGYLTQALLEGLERAVRGFLNSRLAKAQVIIACAWKAATARSRRRRMAAQVESTLLLQEMRFEAVTAFRQWRIDVTPLLAAGALRQHWMRGRTLRRLQVTSAVIDVAHPFYASLYLNKLQSLYSKLEEWITEARILAAAQVELDVIIKDEARLRQVCLEEQLESYSELECDLVRQTHARIERRRHTSTHLRLFLQKEERQRRKDVVEEEELAIKELLERQ